MVQEKEKIQSVFIFKMNEDFNANKSIYDIQTDYFENELKNINRKKGRYRVPNRNDKRYPHTTDITKDDIILFTYRNRFIATAKVVSGQYFFEITEESKNKEWNFINWNDENEKIFDHYYQLNIDSIKIIPPVEIAYCDELFDGNINCRTTPSKVYLKKEKEEEFNNLINSKELKSNLKKWDNVVKDIIEPSLLKEISLYNYENIHTSFLCNFIRSDNVYGLKNEPMLSFIKLLKNKSNNKLLTKIYKDYKEGKIDIQINPQKRYKKVKESIIPDVMIDFKYKDSSEKYHILIEAKVCATENVYENEVKQCDKYYNFFDENKNIIYVFLTMKHTTPVKNYINITWNDIYDGIYKNYEKVDKKDNINHYHILREYLKSYKYLCDREKFDFSISDIPPVYIIDKEKINNKLKEVKEDIKEISKYKIPKNILKEKLFAYRYFMVLVYNLHLNIIDDDIIEKCYNNLV